MSDSTTNPDEQSNEGPDQNEREGVDEWVDSNGYVSPDPVTGSLLELKAAWQRVRLVFLSDENAFSDLDDSEAVGGSVVALVSIFAAAIGGWLYVAIVGNDSLSITRVILGSVLAGTAVAFAAWLGWVFIVHWWMEREGHEVNHFRLVAAMGFAAAPFSISILMFSVIPAFGIAVVALAWWFVQSQRAITAVLPQAPPGRVQKANLAGFAAFVVVLSLLAFAAGLAPGPFVFSRL